MKNMTFSGSVKTVFAAALVAAAAGGPALAAGGEAIHYERHNWSYDGITGQYDRAQLRRGWQVYQNVCAACHGLERVKFRNLVQPGGPEFDEEAVKLLAKEWPNQIVDGPNDEGEVVVDGELRKRAPKLSDKIKGPFANEKQGRALNNGAYPPDLSLITRARNVHSSDPWYLHVPSMAYDILTGYETGGSDYLYSLLTGYGEPPEGFQLSEGMSYNKYFPGHQIAMAQPLYGEDVEYQENAGAEPTLEQHAADVTAFLAWAADPKLNQRKQLGWSVMIYLLITTVLLYLAKKRIWARVKH